MKTDPISIINNTEDAKWIRLISESSSTDSLSQYNDEGWANDPSYNKKINWEIIKNVVKQINLKSA